MSKENTSYRLIDSGNFQKLEEIGPYRLVRPSPQAVWRPRLPESEWLNAAAKYTRFSGGDGEWKFKQKVADEWRIEFHGVKLVVRLTDFGHIGLFAEQGTNWDELQAIIKKSQVRPFRVLNLFAYTGGSTLACALAGAEVVHLDASKTSVAWARENADLNRADLPVRWIVDDVRKFVAREKRRGSRYHGVILDPPSFGRGAKNEVWKIEDDLPVLLGDLKEILEPQFSFILLSSHTSAYTPEALKNLLHDVVAKTSGAFQTGEMVIPEAGTGRLLPSGSYCLFER